MGYSLTNDSNSEVATSQKPDDVTLTSIGLSFLFWTWYST